MARIRPVLVEIAGVAGAGKSTVVRLLEREPGWRRAEFISARRPRHVARILRALPRLAPILVRNLAMAPRLSWADVKLLAYVTGWHGGLDRSAEGVTLLDQGPLYALVRLKAQGRGVGRTPAFARWWDGELARWASELDVVVALDADDEVLLGRIDGREQRHLAKGATRDDASRFLARYRALFAEAIERIELPGAADVVRLDTGSTRPEGVAADVRSAVEALGADVRATTGSPS
jgi:thymidylate kinase